MMRHVLLVPDRFASRDRTGERSDHLAPVELAGGDDAFAARMLESGVREVVGVQRLVDHRTITAVLPGAHHGGGDVARPRPYGEAQRCHGGTCAAVSRSMSC